MISYSITLKGIDVTNDVVSGFTVEQSIADELDSATILLKRKYSITLQRMQLATITAGGLFFRMAIDNVIEEKLPSGMLIYTVSLIELTKVLENIIIDGMAIKTREYGSTTISTMRDVLYLAIKKINIALNNKYTYDSTNANSTYDAYVLGNKAYLSTINDTGALDFFLNPLPAEDFIWDGPHTAREILDDILATADIAVRVNNIEVYNGIYSVHVTCDNPNYRKKITSGAIDDYCVGHSEDEASEFNVGSIISTVKKAVSTNENRDSLTEITKRTVTENAIWNTKDAMLYTKYPIEKIIKIKALTAYEYTAINSSTGHEYSDQQLRNYVDITDLVIEKTKYDILSKDDKSEHAYYEKGKSYINGFYDSLNILGFGVGVSIMKIIRRAKAEEIALNGYVFYKVDNSDIDFQINEINNTGINRKLENSKSHTIGFTVEYVPQVDSIFDVSRNVDSALILSHLKTLDNQSKNAPDVNRTIANLNNKAKRIGNRERVINCIHKETSSILALGSTLDGYVFDKRTLCFEENVIKVSYNSTYGFNSRNERIALSREKRLYDIPLNKFVTRRVLFEITAYSQNYYLYKSNQRFCFAIRRNSTDTNRLLIPAYRYYDGDIIYFIADFYSNYGVDIKRSELDKKEVCIEVPYVGDNGGLRLINNIILFPIKLTGEAEEILGIYPECDSLSKVYQTSGTYNNRLIEIMNVAIWKDAYEKLQLVFKISKA